ncbi:hypothetical protein F511_26382 [Dorcoceras hygrometricum]|uniref:Dystroglycan-like n=1 Tax=Dorcoceras hygrometricum TaxID=472368 RepID=A0A2Z7D924_9LAMI|nr:hypothetical protein F511_26382 [Dorcoceras hygrometricum]
MESLFITNALQVRFESVLGILDNEGMVQIFRALEATGLRGFLGCPSVLYEQELEQFFDTALVQDGDITCVVSGKYVAISETRFSGVFNLPTDGLTDLSEVPYDLVLQARTLFSKSSVPVQFSCNKRLMKYEFRLLNNIFAKSITVKAGSFDAVTHERFLIMTAIHFGIKVNWSKILFEVLEEMADRTTKRAKGFAAQICVLLKCDPTVTLGESKTFPLLKILSAKTVNTYITTNRTIDARGESDEPEVAKDTAEVQMETAAPAVKKTRTKTGKDAIVEKDLMLVVVAQEALSIQAVEPISAVPAERPHAKRRKAPKRKLRLSIDVVEPDFAESVTMGTDLKDMEEDSVKYRDTDFQLVESATGKDIDPEPVADPAKIKFSNGISITGVADGDWFKANLPKIAIDDKGKAPLVEPDTIKGHPAREMFHLICGDIEFLVQLREKVIDEVSAFFSSSSLRHLAVLKSLNGIAANEEHVFTWGETDSVQVSLERRLYIVAKYRQMSTRVKVPVAWSSDVVVLVSAKGTQLLVDEDSIYANQDVQVAEDQRPDPTVSRSSSTDSSMHFNADDTLLGTKTAIQQIIIPTTTAPTTELSEQFAQLRASISQLSIKQMRTQSSIGNLQNHILSRIDDLEKASTNAHTQQDQDLRGHFKSVHQEVQIKKTALSFEVLELKKGIRAQSGIFMTELADIRKEIKDQSKEFDDKLDAIRNDLLEFRVETQEQYASLSANLAELITFVTRGHDDKKGKVGSSHGRGQPPPEDKSKPGSGDGGSSGSRSEPSQKRGSSGSKQRDWRYWING